MSNQTPYIGSKISLISKLDIRYEGILYTVDTTDSTIALAKVRSFGTEDRPAANPVAPRDDVYEYIIFKANDIKDLIVCETPKPAAAGLTYDPAIVSVSDKPVSIPEEKPSAASSGSATPHRGSPGFSPGANRAPGAGRGGRGRGYSHDPLGGYQQQTRPRGGFSSAPRGNRGFSHSGIPRPSQNPRDKLKFDGDYDFEKANEQFQEQFSEVFADKLKIEGERSEEEETPVNDDAFYDKKSSFFDRISCEALEKAEGKSGRPDWKKERETNQETFGHSAVRSLNYRRGYGQRGRAGNRGGYGQGYNGYNRGYSNGYNSYRSNNYGSNTYGGQGYKPRQNQNRDGFVQPNQ